MGTARTVPEAPTTGLPAAAVRGYSVLVDLVALLIVVQGVLAGVFLQHDGQRGRYDSWISAHGLVGDAALLLAALSAVLALARLRPRRDLGVGSTVLTVLLLVETLLGGRIGEGSERLTVVHVPLALALMGLAVWLVVRAIALRREPGNG